MGLEIDLNGLLEFVTEEYARINQPVSPERHIGAKASLPSVMEDFQQGLEDIGKIIANDSSKLRRGATYLTERMLQMTSALFSAGYEPRIWRRWSSLTSLGFHIIHRRLSAAHFAILAGEWELLARIERTPISLIDVADYAIWKLIGGEILHEPKYRDDPFEKAWIRLPQSIPRHEHEETEASLKVITDYWIGESSGTWEKFHPGEYPNFEPVVNAVAKLACHSGYKPIALSSDQLRFLEAGLSLGEPSH